MASSRLEKIGTIFTRVSALLKKNVMKADDKPIWYDVLATFPPLKEPRYDSPAKCSTVRPIFYNEDTLRANYYKDTSYQSFNLMGESTTRQLIQTYQHLKQQGAIDENQLIMIISKLRKQQLKPLDVSEDANRDNRFSTNLVDDYSKAVHNINDKSRVDIKNIFKD